jgi:hypothetical protein
VLKEMQIHPVKQMDEVLRFALALERPEEFLPQPTAAIDWRLALQASQVEGGTPAGGSEPH